MPDSNIFRKVSLERLSSPEQLDRLMQVTTPLGWVSLLALGILVALAIFWGIYGTITTEVMGQGIITQIDQILSVESSMSGRIDTIYVEVGGTVKMGQLVARIDQRELLLKLNEDKESLRGMKEQYDQMSEYATAEIQARQAQYAKQRKDYEQALKMTQERIGWIEEKISNQTRLLQKGLIAKQDLLNTKTDLFNMKQDLEKAKTGLKQISVDELEFKNQQQLNLLNQLEKISELEAKIIADEENIELESKIFSPYSGRVLEVVLSEGTPVNVGDKILTLSLTGETAKGIESLIYVPAKDGKRVKAGMKVRISPTTVKEEEWGSMLGIVTYVSEFPATRQGMIDKLQNDKLADTFSSGGAPIEVRAALLPNPNTVSGYKWTSPKGPPVKIEAGTVCIAMVTVEEQPPISLVIPLFKKYFLGVGAEIR